MSQRSSQFIAPATPLSPGGTLSPDRGSAAEPRVALATRPRGVPGDKCHPGLALGASILFHGLVFLAVQLLTSGAAPFGIFSRDRAVVAVDSPTLVIELLPPALVEPAPEVEPALLMASSDPDAATGPVRSPLLPQPETRTPHPVVSPQPLPEPEPQPAPEREPVIAVTAPITEPVITPAPLATSPPEPVPAIADAVVTAPANRELEAAPPAPAQRPGGELNTLASNDAVSLLIEPRYRLAPPPPYPGAARRLGLEGRVLLEVRVNATGSVDAATVLESSGHRILDHAALSAVKRWRFHPASRGKLPTASSALIPVEFKLE